MQIPTPIRQEDLGDSISGPGTNQRRVMVAVRGMVQGVGFRPFIYSLAQRFGVAGLVRNDAEGVYIEAQAASDVIDAFLASISHQPPRLARIEQLAIEPLPLRSGDGFRIEASRDGGQRVALISPDVSSCEACVDELFDPSDRRYRYPFINCTDCGPRFSITRAVPYDRRTTTMVGFAMCADCVAEYADPTNRRFHAQPNACPVCGPSVQLVDRRGEPICDVGLDPITAAVERLHAGQIVAIKGLGGYHLCCDPFNPVAAQALRSRKARQDKPFALMARDMSQIRSICNVTEAEEALLLDVSRPIVVLAAQPDSGLASEIAPRQRTLGVMLAYTPIHHVLLADAGMPLVMTSGNRADEPIAYRDDEALEQLGQIADAFLFHNRPIHVRCDDSVMRVVRDHAYPLRRSRGHAPAPVSLAQPLPQHTLACGGELKNTFCVARDRHAFVSHHIGDLENYQTLRSFQEGVTHFCSLFDIQPTLVAYDLHPEYLSTAYARELEDEGMQAVGIQHHHAHVASCLVDNGRPYSQEVIGVAFDGTGYGADGTLWGGEFFQGSIEGGFRRRVHLRCLPLPGGETAIRQPWRIGIAALLELWSEDEVLALPLQIVRDADDSAIHVLRQMIANGINTPRSSGAGRLFDAVAALLLVPASRRTTYEGQAAIELELMATGEAHRGYPVNIQADGDGWVVDTRAIIAAVVDDLMVGLARGEIASRFHRTMADVVLAACRQIAETDGTRVVALSGGTFQNMLLLEQVTDSLEADGFEVLRHRQVPANDGGLSLGQVVLADAAINHHR